MIQKFKLLGAVAGITFAGAMAASAATFFTVGGVNQSFPTAGTGPGDYTLPLPAPLPTDITVYSNGQSGVGVDMTDVGLALTKKTKLLFTYLGKDAGYRNLSFGILGADLFDTKLSDVGDKVFQSALSGGLLELLFKTSGGGTPGEIANGTGTGSVGLSLAYSISADGKTAYAFFDDGGSAPGLKGDIDLDYDDLAFSISAIPVPAGGLLLISGLGALAAVRRRKQA